MQVPVQSAGRPTTPEAPRLTLLLGCLGLGCLGQFMGILLSRLALIGVWLGSDWFGRAFAGEWSWLGPLLGLLYCPLAVLFASFVYNSLGGSWTYGTVIGLVLAIAFDNLLNGLRPLVLSLKEQIRERLLTKRRAQQSPQNTDRAPKS